MAEGIVRDENLSLKCIERSKAKNSKVISETEPEEWYVHD